MIAVDSWVEHVELADRTEMETCFSLSICVSFTFFHVHVLSV